MARDSATLEIESFEAASCNNNLKSLNLNRDWVQPEYGNFMLIGTDWPNATQIATYISCLSNLPDLLRDL